MTLGSEKIPGKKKWSKLCWERAWASEDAYWQSTTVLHRDIKLLSSVLTDTQYLTWWYISDNDLSMIRICENMVKILCRASRFKCDDPSLKGSLASVKACELCDQYAPEDIRHILMQCPHFQDIRDKMMQDIYKIDPSIERMFVNKPRLVFPWLLGNTSDECGLDMMNAVLRISGHTINSMYKQVVGMRKGVG